MKCSRCKKLACVALPSHTAGFCKDCFPLFFTKQVETAIRREKMFTHDERILVALSGGKDSLTLMLELKLQGMTSPVCISISVFRIRLKRRGRKSRIFADCMN